jgi:tryptophan synthase beta chain
MTWNGRPQRLPHALLGAEVVPVTSGRGTLKDAMNDALRDWVTNVRDTFYCIGTVAGPHPYPAMVRDFQSIIGKEVRWQLAEQEGEGRLPDTVIAAIGGGSNAMGLFYPFLDDPSVNIIGVEAGGKGVDDRMQHCASLTGGRPGVLHGNRTYLLQDEDGQILEGFSISPGSTIPASARNMPGCMTSAAPNTSASPMPRRWRRSSFPARWKGSSPRWSPATRWPM